MPGIDITGKFQPAGSFKLYDPKDNDIAGSTDYTGVTVASTDLLICDTGAGDGSVGKITVSQLGTVLQPIDATLTSISTLGTAANKMLYTTDVDTWAETSLTAYGAFLIATANEAAFKSLVNLEIGTDVQAWDTDLDWLAANITAVGKAILDDATAEAQRTTLGLGATNSPTFYNINLSSNQITSLNSGLTLAVQEGYAINFGGTANLNEYDIIGAGAITGTSFIIGENTLDSTEWAYLDGQNQAVKTTDDVQFDRIGAGVSPSVRLHAKGESSVTTVGAVNKLTADGGFDSSDGWSGTGWTIASSKATHTTSTVALEGTTTVESGKIYQINFTIVSGTIGGFDVYLGTNSCNRRVSTNASYSLYAIASGNNVNVKFTPFLSATNKAIDSVTIYEITASVADAKIESSDGSANPFDIRAGGDSLGSFFLGTGGGTLNLGVCNTGLGVNVLASNISGTYNSGLGPYALKSNIYGSYNTAVGPYALYSLLFGDNVVAIGPYTFYSLPSASSGGVAIGPYAFQNYSGTYPSVAIGPYAGQNTTTGIGLTLIGGNALKDNTTGGYDVVVGTDAALVTLIENYSTIVGYQSLKVHKLGQLNTTLGYKTGLEDISGELNTLVGAFAGETLAQPIITITGIANNGSGKCRYTSVGHGLTTANFGYTYECDVSTYNTVTPGTTWGISAKTDDTFDTTQVYTSAATTAKVVKYGANVKNTMLGAYAGDRATILSNCIFLGAYAGSRQTTIDNLLIIDNQDRSSAANEITNSLIYGVLNATPASQTLNLNANVLCRYGVRTKRAVTNTANPPTDAELDTAFGNPSAVGDGFIGILDDNDAAANIYLCVSTGVDADKWWYATLTQAA